MGEYFLRITSPSRSTKISKGSLADSEGSPDLLGNYHASKIIDTPDNACRFHVSTPLTDPSRLLLVYRRFGIVIHLTIDA